MIYQLEIQDDDLFYIEQNLKHGSFTLDRWSSSDGERIGRLSNLGMIERLSYEITTRVFQC